MQNRTRLLSRTRNKSVLLSLLMTLSLFVGLFGRPQLAQAQLGQPTPLPTPTPNPLAPPLVVPQHTLPPTVAPPRPPTGVPAATLPNIEVARNLGSSFALLGAVPQVGDLWNHAMMRCMDDCGGGEPPGGGGSDPDFSTARTRPSNDTGEPGVDLGSRNFNWGLPLVSLPGRAGLGLNLALYYNSLVWTKEGSAIRFNSDRGFPGPGPGFTLGLPKVQRRYLNQDYSVYSYMVVTPSGGHVELRQVGPDVYESGDSSYTQLIDYGSTKLMRTTDGTQYSFAASPTDGEFNCVQITERNGNYFSASYNGNGDIAAITDTLGRVINFNYDSANYLLSITQTWTVNGQPETHLWAQFNYTSIFMQTNFPGLWVQGPNNTAIPVLSAVTLADGSRFTFDYTSWGQVYQISALAADSHLRARTSYNLPMDASTAQTECPRFTEERQWGEYWTEVVTNYAADPNGAWTRVTMPDQTVHMEYFATSGWQTGLTIRSETYSVEDLSNPKKWSTIDWTQDDTSLSFQKNPRIVETNTFDAQGNRKRVAVSYGPPEFGYVQFGLPYEVLEYAADAATPFRSTYTNYDLNPAYIDRRIIGLPSAVHVVDHTIGWFVSKTTYHYDWDNGTNTYLIDQGGAVQHDNANYGPSFILGRGNLCAVRRWNVNAINDENQAMWVSYTGYNTNGSTIFAADGLGHETRVSYTDAFSDGGSRSTFAYPTTVTDPGAFLTPRSSTTTLAASALAAIPKARARKLITTQSAEEAASQISRTTLMCAGFIRQARTTWIPLQPFRRAQAKLSACNCSTG